MRKDLTGNVRRLYNQGMTQRELAKRYGVSQVSIHYVLRGRGGSVKKKERLVSWRAKLTPAQVRRMRRMYETGKFTMAALAPKFGVSQATVSNIANNKVYRKIA